MVCHHVRREDVGEQKRNCRISDVFLFFLSFSIITIIAVCFLSREFLDIIVRWIYIERNFGLVVFPRNYLGL